MSIKNFDEFLSWHSTSAPTEIEQQSTVTLLKYSLASMEIDDTHHKHITDSTDEFKDYDSSNSNDIELHRKLYYD